MPVLKIGIDNGNYNIKSSERMLHASGFATSDREFITSDMQLFYDGVYYAIGGKRMKPLIFSRPSQANDAAITSLTVFYKRSRITDWRKRYVE
jgi:hypothetical protein